MRCLICNKNFDVEVLRNHYKHYHSVKENNYFFRELFPPDNSSKDVMNISSNLKIAGRKKKHNFIFHRN